LDRSRSAGAIVRFLGTGEVCSDYLSVLCRPDRQAEVATELAGYLSKAGASDRWDALELENVECGDSMLQLLVERLRECGTGVYTSPTDSTWRIELPGSTEEYLGLLSKSHRKQLRRFRRRFFEAGRAVLRTVERADQLDTGWRILTQLHQRRLESLGKPGCFQSDAFTKFHWTATEAMHTAGCLRLHWLELDGQPVAAEYHLAGDEVMFAYQGGIEPTALECEPGRLITLATLESAIGSGYQAFDFCRGDEPYKAHFRAKPRENLTYRIVCDRPSARLRHGVWVAGQSARKWMKGGLQRAVGKSS
jgi:hypothetical protein